MHCGPISAARRRSAGGSGDFGSHRYWRIFVSANNGGASNTQIAEIEFHSTVGGADITGSGTALSGGSGADVAGAGAAKAFDNTSIPWARSSPTNTWVGYDFGAAVTVAEFTLSCPTTAGQFTDAPQSFTLDYSDDGVTWTTATGGTFTAFMWVSGASRTYPEHPVAGFHRCWRVFCTDNNGGTSFIELAEVELRATSGGADQTASVGSNNGNSSGRIIGSSIANGGDEGFRAFDNSTSSIWAGSGTTNQWVGFVFPAPVTVLEAAITGSSQPTRMVKNGHIDWSDDGSTWTSAGSFTQTGWTTGQVITVAVTP